VLPPDHYVNEANPSPKMSRPLRSSAREIVSEGITRITWLRVLFDDVVHGLVLPQLYRERVVVAIEDPELGAFPVAGA
jgi:hypothetical protein